MTVLNEVSIGETLETTLNPVSRMDLIKYSGSSGDFNPIHTIDEEAVKAGLPGIIAHGMWTMGNLSKLFTPYYEEGLIKDYNIRFSGMVFLNDVLTLKAKLIEKDEQSLTFEVKATNQNQRDVVQGKLKFELY
ncbi:MaoC/PaaZ C-terminal domain-containing protein [Lysinibacillus sp. SGAir0095]|uniref:MaoC/PaaZ C-terminal domain-containing protein n=1 Tax=Lysinibacillus sp. SGAir0095 TaxID=2070463 RepID=UPI0010CCCA0E|nr:MaoC/PaaZ C-terminal domain-containing protein [Lysinibacillus sp. SGAir0095]QCR32674.1 dehydratase [Lysinibacillus sp. SGAir0095]